jgi:hypothetical protein
MASKVSFAREAGNSFLWSQFLHSQWVGISQSVRGPGQQCSCREPPKKERLILGL